MTDLILTEIDGRVLKLTFNRPDKKNAITHEMYTALADGLQRAREDDDIRTVYITGNGDSFTAGNDLADFRDNPPLGGEAPVNRFLGELVKATKPIVVAVNGIAVGVGLTMLLHSDVVIAGESAVLSAPFVDLALVPEAASSLLLPRVVGAANAADIFFTGRRVTANEALTMGLVSRVMPDADLKEGVLEIAHSVAAKAPQAVKLTKALMRKDKDVIAARMQEEGGHFNTQLQSAEVLEAITAFMQKRAPNFG
ncbi:enoyl-CoA hydratase [Kordiimonas sp. SCSIO 12610]|uniref:enoyl-CoA hydratase n=1 Tax=Kordiimonas sp. SCSIO 12610 TaxID=2829597 RepID=UPI00210CE894|nr:enoyl-CoA hydratase [Kordiimonas sp. SCSIO 12610]UTW56352.1 enoyl-CoA hydratase [Kordiimonas sp. SCSIO 12610]